MIRRNLVMGELPRLALLDQLYLGAATPVSAQRCTSFRAPHESVVGATRTSGHVRAMSVVEGKTVVR